MARRGRRGSRRGPPTPEKAPLRQRVKEWGEAADVWSRVAVRFGLAGFGLTGGTAAVEILQKAIGG